MAQALTHSHKIILAITLVILGVPIAFNETSAQMEQVWNVNETFTHGYLIFPITLWLIWRERNLLKQYSIEPELRPLLLLVMAQIAWLLGDVVNIQVVKQIAMIGMIPVLVWMLMGRKILYATLFPICYLLFAVPIGQGLIPPMMNFTADFTVLLIQLSSIPVYRDGLYFSLPSGNWSVVEECSGVRYLIASLALGTLYAYITYRSFIKRVLFILLAALIPIIANGLRAYGIVLLGHFSDMKLAVGADHLIYGWVFFGVIVFTMFYLGSFWRDPIQVQSNKSDLAENVKLTPYKTTLITTLAMSLALTFGIKLAANQIFQPDPVKGENLTFSLPRNFEAWQRLDTINIGWSPIFQSPDIEKEAAYRFDNEIIQVNIGYYFHQRQGAEAVSSQNRITNPYSGQWRISSSIDLQFKDHYVTESEIRAGAEKILVWHWYQLGNKQTPNPYIAKMLEAYNKITSNRHDVAVITLAIRSDNQMEARINLQSFLELFLIALDPKFEALARSS